VTRARDAGLVGAAFSLDGLRAEHDALRRPGSYERVVAAIDRTVSAGFPVAVNTTITRLNYRMFGELRDFLIARGVFAWQLQFATPTGNLADHRDIVIDAADFLWLIPQIARICRANTPKFCARASDDVGYYGRPEQDLRNYDEALPFWVGCRAGCQVIGIESNGDVKGCLSLPSSVNGEQRFIEGNLRTSTLAAIWRRPGAFSYNREWQEADLAGFCGVCRYREFCRGGCTWTKYTEGASNPYCFYYQAAKAGRFDLLEEDPTEDEKAYLGALPGSSTGET
jgi:radical SAM protein with 4Fe4S-binding SPASM domain